MKTLIHLPTKANTAANILVRMFPTCRLDVPSTEVVGPINAGHQFSYLAVNNPVPAMQSCPFTCPTGGACHLCPART